MRLAFPFILIISVAFIISCAQQGNPTGGPKDTIPPTLLESYPEDKTLNYTSKEFKFIFDERITADKLKQSLIITPFTENKFEFKVKKNQLLIAFEESFDSLTTYTLNFADGVTDVTEKNPAINLKLAFSTGPIIDSIYVSGVVTDLYKNEPLDQILVTLYHISDTLNLLTGKPRYFTKTDEDGNFLIENIKDGKYRIYAFDDKNNNMTNEPDEEAHGFLADTLDLSTSRTDINIRTQLLNINPLRFSRGKTSGIYYDIVYNKYIEEYDIKLYRNPKRLPVPKNNLIDANKSIRMYYDSAYIHDKDSIGLIINAYDSLENQSIDTVFVKFRESKRKAATFNATLTPSNNSKIDPRLELKFQFDKPIDHFNQDSIRFQYDTLYYNILPDSLFQWNKNQTELKIKVELNRTFFKKKIDSLSMMYADTANKDSIYVLRRNYLSRIDTLSQFFVTPASAFISTENDSSKSFIHKYSFKRSEDFGSVSGTVNTQHASYILQLVTTGYKVVKSLKSPTKYYFGNIKPGKYTFRILLDTNEDGIWDYGNLLQNKEAEPIFFYEEEFDLRANWQLENIDISF